MKTTSARSLPAVLAGCLATSSFLQGESLLVDLELSLVVDVSGSVDDTEYALQMNGYAAAFENPLLHAAISSTTIAVNLVQFSSSAAESIGWTLLTDAATSNAFAAEVRAATRLFSGGTNIDSGIDLAATLITTNAYSGRRVVIDVSGDGEGASGASRDAAEAQGITINGIVISDFGGALLSHYQNFVITSDGFVEEAVTFTDFEPAVLRKLQREISGDTNEAARLVSSTLRTSGIAIARAMTADVGGRLFQMRSGIRSESPAPPAPPPTPGPKGGMVHDAAVYSTPTQIASWEVWGQLFYSDQKQDAQYQSLPLGLRRLVQARSDTETFGGNLGLERRLANHITLGLAFGAAETDIRMRRVASIDVDSLAVMPYVSYYRPSVFRGADFYADALYAYIDNDYRIRRDATGVRGSTDGHSHQIEVNTGLNFRGGQFVHGPFTQLRWLDGKVDGFTERGLGGLTYGDADYESLATQLGYQVSMPVRLTGGAVIPQASLAWEHEFEHRQGSIAGVPLGELDEDIAVLGAGIGVHLNTGWNGILQYQARLGGDAESHWVGLRFGREF